MALSFFLYSVEIIKRNSREFKDVKKLLKKHRKDPLRKKLIVLYSVRPAEELKDRVPLTREQSAFYDLSYDALLDHLENDKKKLFREGNEPLYFFKSSSASPYIELPFEFRGKLKKWLFPLKVVKKPGGK
jgi:hypothetical protein